MEQNNQVAILEQWHEKYIDYFRKEYKKLSSEEQNGIGNSNNFLKPCQIEIFWIKDPDYQFIARSNFNDLKDKEIVVNGPYKPEEFIHDAATVLKNKKWSRSLAQNSTSTYNQGNTLGERMAISIRWFVEEIRQNLFPSLPHHRARLTGTLVEDIWVTIYQGNIGNLNYAQKVDETIEEIKQFAKLKLDELILPQPEKSTSGSGFGVYFFPPTMIGEKHKPTINDLIHNPSYTLTYDKKALDAKIKQYPIIINDAGFVFVGTDETHLALKILNLIMACGRLHKVNLYAVNEHELVPVDYDEQELILTDRPSNSDVRRAYIPKDRFNLESTNPTEHVVEPKIIREILSDVENILECDRLTTDMIFLNKALTHFENSEFIQSFFIGWSLIERHYSELWRILVVKKNITGTRFDKLTNSGRWSFDNILESLNLHDQINNDSYEQLNNLKKIRNKLYHTIISVTEDEAKPCLMYATKLIYNQIKLRLPYQITLRGERNLI